MSLQSKIDAWLDQFSIGPDSTIIVACSGGPDSMALLDLMKKSGSRIIAAHVNYHKRGDESDRDEGIVKAYCRSHEIGCRVKQVDPDKSKGNFQNWAREVRYRFFDELLDEFDADLIVTAHHQQDHLETLLIQVLKGAHPASWQGITEYSGKIGRPLLEVSKEEILDYLNQWNIPFGTDATNLDSAYARNLIRNEQFEQFDRLLPGWRQNLLNIPTYALEYSEFANCYLKSVLTASGSLDRTEFFNLSPVLRKPVFAAWLAQHDIAGQVARSQFERLDDLEEMQAGRRIQLNKDYFIEVDRNELILSKNPERCAFWSEFLNEERLETGWKIGVHNFAKSANKPFDDHYLQLNWDRLRLPLTLRTWRPGDRIQPLGMRGHKKVSDVLTDEKVASSEKSEAMVLQGFDQTIYAVIFPASHEQPGILSEAVRCGDSDQTVLLITKMD